MARACYLTLEDGGHILLESEPGALLLEQCRRSNILLQDPRFLTLDRWSATITADLGLLPILPREESWKEWAAEVARVVGNAPDPTPYSRWRDWALAWLRST